jgi:hypothetical protein
MLIATLSMTIVIVADDLDIGASYNLSFKRR